MWLRKWCQGKLLPNFVSQWQTSLFFNCAGLQGVVKVVVPNRKRIPKDPAIQEGKPLPNFGTCKHYKKSYRWLRFPCCGKCYPCDICHDSKEDHEMKYANRMICGFCCKEQVIYSLVFSLLFFFFNRKRYSFFSSLASAVWKKIFECCCLSYIVVTPTKTWLACRLKKVRVQRVCSMKWFENPLECLLFWLFSVFFYGFIFWLACHCSCGFIVLGVEEGDGTLVL